MIDKVTLDFMLDEWARFCLSEFNELNWSSSSMSGKIIEIAKLGIYSHGTSNKSSDCYIPKSVENTIEAMMQLEPKYIIILREEYTGSGRQKLKARRLQLPLGQYKNRLYKARQQLMRII